MKTLLSFSILGLVSLSVTAQIKPTTWYGSLPVPSHTLPLVFHITKANGHYNTTIDSPAQQANALATDTTIVKNDSLIVRAGQLGMVYKAVYNSVRQEIVGTLTQGSSSLPLTLSLTKPADAAAPVVMPRPQDPKAIAYKQVEVTIPNKRAQGVTLAGTLTLPATGKPKKVVVLIRLQELTLEIGTRTKSCSNRR